jgi:cytidyltransferase-like protein
MNTSKDKALILPYDKIGEISKKITGKRVLVGGCFDVLHFGHITFLAKARAAGEALIVALEPDEFITKKKAKKPVHTQDERAHILAALRDVDAIVMLPFFHQDEHYLQMTRSIAPQVIAVSEGDPNYGKKLKHAQVTGAKLAVVTPHLRGFSSSKAQGV